MKDVMILLNLICILEAFVQNVLPGLSCLRLQGQPYHTFCFHVYECAIVDSSYQV